MSFNALELPAPMGLEGAVKLGKLIAVASAGADKLWIFQVVSFVFQGFPVSFLLLRLNMNGKKWKRD